MTDPQRPRRFDDDEVSLIIRRASELQEAQQTRVSEGMTLTDLEGVARETGLDPALVRRAAAEIDIRHTSLRPESRSSAFLGAPTTLDVERVIDGELSTDAYEALVDTIRRALNDVGVVSTLGRTLAWSSAPRFTHRQQGGRQINVTISPRGGVTTIRVEENLGSLAGGLFGGIMGGVGGVGSGIAMGVGLGTLHSGLAAGGLWATFIGASYTLARTIFTSMVSRRARQLIELADQLSEQAVSAIEATR